MNIQEFRRKHKLTWRALAEALGIKTRSCQQYAYKSPPDTIKRLIKCLWNEQID